MGAFALRGLGDNVIPPRSVKLLLSLQAAWATKFTFTQVECPPYTHRITKACALA